MSTEIKRYRLLKDLPYVKAGAIYQLDEGDTYVCDTETAQFTDGTKWDGLGKCAVENAAEGWFELIPEQSKMPKQERIEVEISSIKYPDGGTEYKIKPNKLISEDKFPLIKEAIEQALNPTTDTNTEKIAIKFVETDSQLLESTASKYEDWYYMPFWFQKI